VRGGGSADAARSVHVAGSEAQEVLAAVEARGPLVQGGCDLADQPGERAAGILGFGGAALPHIGLVPPGQVVPHGRHDHRDRRRVQMVDREGGCP
jgi:hypothetical protein